MTRSPDILALAQALALCQGHLEGLQDALTDIQHRALSLSDYAQPSKSDRRLLDQFAYRYTRLQDDMGAKLMPAVLRVLGENVAAMPALDRFSRLEQIGWLHSAEDWNVLRQIRSQFTHDYPDTASERFERLQAAIGTARQMIVVLKQIEGKIHQRFSDIDLAPTDSA